MASRLRLFAGLCALVTAAVVVWQSSPASLSVTRSVQLRSTFARMDEPSTTIKSPVIALTDPSPFDPCQDIPIDVIRQVGLAFTPPEHEDGSALPLRRRQLSDGGRADRLAQLRAEPFT